MGGADVSIRTLGSRPSNRRNPRPRRQRIAQAAGIGNSVAIIDDESKLRDSSVCGRAEPPGGTGETPVVPQAC